MSKDKKVKYKTKEIANKTSKYMMKKYDVDFSSYKCLYCDWYHVGKNKG